jgi:hypothetical protein
MLFVFGALMEYAAMLYSLRHNKLYNKTGSLVTNQKVQKEDQDGEIFLRKKFLLVDTFVFALALTMFVLFNLAYFTYFLA